MNTDEKLTLEDFTEQVRQDCITIMSRAAFGHSKEAAALAGELCARAASIIIAALPADEVLLRGSDQPAADRRNC